MIISKIRAMAKAYPDRIVYKVREKSLTYAAWWERAEYAASLLNRQGNSPVVLYGHKEPEMVIAMLACLIAGRAYVPVESTMPLSRVEKILAATGSTLIITNENVGISGVECAALEELKRYEKREICPCENTVAYIIFTSGSTGEPKGVPISRDNLNHFAAWISGLHPLCDYENVTVLNQAGFGFDLSVADFYYAVCNGHTLVAYDGNIREGYDGLFELWKREKIHVAVMTPTFMKLCLLNRDFCEKVCPDFRCVYFCGELLEPKTVRLLLERFPRLNVINAYGPTEATSAISAILITKETAETEPLLPVGEVKTFATAVEIVEEEIVLKGDSVFGGYLGDVAGGFYKEGDVRCYKTGDRGWIRDQKLYCKGRFDDQIKFKGYRIELGEIEHHIGRIPGVQDCAVVASRDGQGVVKTVKAFVVACPDVDADGVKRQLQATLPEYMIPKSIKFLERLPTNSNGKIDRKALSAL